MIKYFFLLLGIIGYSQKHELGEVTVEELSQKQHSVDSTAPAAYIFKKGMTDFILFREGNWEMVTKVDVKIKIYNKDGLNQANQEILYFSGNNRERINITNANTYNLVNNQVIRTKVRSDGEFKEEINDRWSKKKITFPDVKVGSIIEYSYKITSPYINNFDDWYFQYDIPVDYSEYTVYIPEFFTYRSVSTGYEEIHLDEKIISRNSDFNKLMQTYYVNLIPAIKEEKFVRNVDNFTSKISFELAEISYPNQPIKKLSSSWESVVKNIYEEDRFGKEIKQKKYFEEDLVQISKILRDEERLDSVFKFVQDRMNWNKKFGYLVNKGVKKAYKEKTGNIAEINLMLVSMLRYLGFDANPILLSTRSNGVSLYPTRYSFNYVIAGVQLDNEMILLDASNKYTEKNILPINAINWFGRLIKENGTLENIVLESNLKSFKSNSIICDLGNSGDIKAKYRISLTNYEAFVFKNEYAKKSKEAIKKKYENEYKNISIKEIDINDKKPQNIIVNFEISSNSLVDQIGSKIYFSPFLFLTLDENPFKHGERKYPIELNYFFEEKFNINIKIPDEYEIEYLPESIAYMTEDEGIIFSFQIANPYPNTVQMTSSIEFKTITIPINNYKSLKLFFDELIKKTNEKIVLKKKS